MNCANQIARIDVTGKHFDQRSTHTHTWSRARTHTHIRLLLRLIDFVCTKMLVFGYIYVYKQNCYPILFQLCKVSHIICYVVYSYLGYSFKRNIIVIVYEVHSKRNGMQRASGRDREEKAKWELEYHLDRNSLKEWESRNQKKSFELMLNRKLCPNFALKIWIVHMLWNGTTPSIAIHQKIPVHSNERSCFASAEHSTSHKISPLLCK